MLRGCCVASHKRKEGRAIAAAALRVVVLALPSYARTLRRIAAMPSMPSTPASARLQSLDAGVLVVGPPEAKVTAMVCEALTLVNA